MARARSSGGHEGVQGALVTDAAKRTCYYCGGTEFMIKNAADDINDVDARCNAATAYITATGSVITGRVYICAQCGREDADLLFIIDTCAGIAAAAVTMTNLDASVANGLAGYKLIPLGGTDVLKEFTISSNTAATPTVITVSVAPNADTNGELVLVTKIDTELTAAS